MQSQITTSSQSNNSILEYPSVEKNNVEETKKQPTIQVRSKKEINWMPDERSQQADGRTQDLEAESDDEKSHDSPSESHHHPENAVLKTTLDIDTLTPEVATTTSFSRGFLNRSTGNEFSDVSSDIDTPAPEVTTTTTFSRGFSYRVTGNDFSDVSSDSLTEQMVLAAEKNDVES